MFINFIKKKFLPIKYWFSQHKHLKQGYNAGRIATQILSLSNQQINQLNHLQNYQQSIRQIQNDNLEASLKFMLNSKKQLEEKYPYSINLQIFLLNRMSIIYKLLGRGDELIQTLQDVYFKSLSLKGYLAVDNLKHLKNLYLAIINYKPEMGEAFVEYLDTQISKFPTFYYKQLLLFSSIVYSMKEENIMIAMQNLTKISPEQSFYKIIYLNNLSWISLWINLKQTRIAEEKKKNLEQSLQLFKDALQIAQTQDIQNHLLKRQENQEQIVIGLKSLTLKQRENKLKQIKLIHKNSHILVMNIAQIYYYLRDYDQAAFWIKLSIETAKYLNDFPRIIRTMAFMAKILQNQGFYQQSQKIYLDSLINGDSVPAYSRKFILGCYYQFLHKNERYYESKNYLDQLMNFGQDSRQRLQNMIIPDFDFSY